METVQILYSEVQTAQHWIFNSAVVLVIMLIIALIILICIFISDPMLKGSLCFLMVLLGTIGVFYAGLLNNDTHWTKYYITINGDINWSHFNEKYEILDVKGDLLEVREKEENFK